MNTRSLTLLSLVAIASVARADVGFEPLGFIPGGSNVSFAFGISDTGLIVGSGRLSGTEVACTFRVNHTTVPLITLLGNYDYSRANAVNAAGTMIAGFSQSASGPEGTIWTSPGTPSGLGDLGGGAYHSIVRASSDSGLVSCGWGTGSNGIRAVRFTNGLRFDLGDFPGGPDRSYATDISANGQIIVGNGSKFGPDDRAFKVGANNVLVELPILPNTTTSNAAAVNGDGSIIAGTCVINAGDRAVRWNGMQIQDLGLFPGAWNAQATAIDPSGRFVAGVASTNQGAWAWLWDNVNGMRRIDNVMSLDGIFAPGWKIERISDIRPHNNDELNMVGWGVNPNGENEAFFLRITMPPAQRLHGIVTLPDLASTEGRPLEIEVRQNGDVKYSTVVPVVDLGIGEYGTFEVLPDLPAGTYQVSFRYGHYLRRTIQANLTSGETLLYPDLINGDVTQDNVVDSDDFDQLVRQFGTDKESSGENWVGTADLNEDDRVDSDDFDILVVNFGQYGDQ